MSSITGMNYYSLDYINSIKAKGYKLIFFTSRRIVHDFYVSHYSDETFIHSKSVHKLILFIVKLIIEKRKYFIYTPTPHPITFIKKQIVTIHDTYVFTNGYFSLLKSCLFKLSIFLSNCKIAYINKTVSLDYLWNIKSGKIYLPNIYLNLNAKALPSKKSRFRDSKSIVIALTGTSSSKKNHQEFLNNSFAKDTNLSFILYGEENNYSNYLIHRFDYLNLKFIDSNSLTIDELFTRVDLLLIQNQNEGFCRPILSALSNNKIVLAPESQIYREFYHQAPIFYSSKMELTSYLRRIISDSSYYELLVSERSRYLSNVFDKINSNSKKALSIFSDMVSYEYEKKSDIL